MKRAESPIGVRAPKGFTLIETLLAVLILASGIIFITPVFFKSGAILASLTRRYEAELLMNNLIVEKEESLRSTGSLDQRASRGEILCNNISYSYELKLVPEDAEGRLYSVTVGIGWHDFKENKISTTACILQ